MSHHKRYSAGRRTQKSHEQAWQQASSTIEQILSDTTDTPEHYFQKHAAKLTNLGLSEFVGASRRGINMQGYINLQDLYLDVGYELVDVADRWCNEVQNYMKRNHPWHNRTGDAERGLGAQVAGMDGDDIAMYLYHSVYYGVYLETYVYPRAGLLEIIQPTLDIYSDVLLERLQGVLSR